MSYSINNSALDKKIDNIRETLHRLTSNCQSEDFPSFFSQEKPKHLNNPDSSYLNSTPLEATFKGNLSESVCFLMPEDSLVVLQTENRDLKQQIHLLTDRLKATEEEKRFLSDKIENNLNVKISELQSKALKDEETIQKLRLENYSQSAKIKELLRMLKVDNSDRKKTPRPRSTSRNTRKPNMIQQLLCNLSLEKEELIIPTIKKLKGNLNNKNFVDKLKKLIVDCSPTLPRPISLKQMWKWVKRLVNEYLEYKEQVEFACEQLKRNSKIRNKEEFGKALCNRLTDHERLLEVISKVKALLRLPPQSTIQEVDFQLSSRLL